MTRLVSGLLTFVLMPCWRILQVCTQVVRRPVDLAIWSEENCDKYCTPIILTFSSVFRSSSTMCDLDRKCHWRFTEGWFVFTVWNRWKCKWFCANHNLTEQDLQGKTRNLAHPALHDTCVAFFYTGPYRVTRRQPDHFHIQLPISCLALVATAVMCSLPTDVMLMCWFFSPQFHCIFDGLEKNGTSKCYPNFSSKDYLPIYRKMLQIIKDTLKDEYHGPRLLAQLREWAEVG